MNNSYVLAQEYCFKVTDGTHDSPKQVTLGKKLITSKHIEENKLDLRSAYLISEADFKKINERSKVDQNDILFSMIGTVGNLYLEKTNKIDYAVKNVGIFKCKSELDSFWLYYYLKSPIAKSYLHSRLIGSTQQYITLESLRNYPIPVVENIKRRKIVEFLSTVDNKINNNITTNKYFEDLAQILYKRWFVDFEFPNEKGEPYKSSGGEMVDSELGLIPKGWEVKELKNTVKNIKNKVGTLNLKVLSAVKEGKLVLSTDFFTKDVPSKNKSKYLIVNRKHFAYNPARINIGSLGLNEYDFDGCVSPVYVVLDTGINYYRFFSIFFKSQEFKNEVKLRAYGSVRQTLDFNNFGLIKVVYPKKSSVESFNQIFDSINDFSKNIRNQSIKLAELRDLLLPKLMSGEIEVPLEE